MANKRKVIKTDRIKFVEIMLRKSSGQNFYAMLTNGMASQQGAAEVVTDSWS